MNKPNQAYPCMLNICQSEVTGDAKVTARDYVIFKREYGRYDCPRSSIITRQRTLHFTWDQELPIPNDISYFTLYEYDGYGNLTGNTFNIPYETDMSYEHDEVITVPDNQSTELCYDLTASDTTGHESGKSNRPCVTVDFEPPPVPGSLTITIQVTP
ncbi:MAG: hypothetical protein ACTSSP_10060, partial [Candidatus Asgardarchaeia archaeon]